MPQQLRPLSSAERDSIEATRRAYRAMWVGLKQVPPRRFAGDPEDINALDFIDYEAGHHPQGLAGAAIIWGGVLAGAGLSWAVGEGSQLFLVDTIDTPWATINPYARVAEINCSAPQFGKYSWALEEAVLHVCSLPIAEHLAQRLGALLQSDPDKGFLLAAREQVEPLLRSGRRPAR